MSAVVECRLPVSGLAETSNHLTVAAAFPATATRAYRSIWISDFHLGTRRCKAAALLEFLRRHESEYLFLVGDLIDGWNFGPAWYWDSAQTALVGELAARRKRGTRVVFLPGNHDGGNPDLIRALIGPVEIQTGLIHRTAEGRRMLVIHGHQLKSSLHPDHWLSLVGSHAYTAALRINLWYNRERRQASRRTVTAYLRRRLKRAVHYLVDFDDRPVFEVAREFKVDGVICGHTHRPDRRTIGPFLYINDGDWVQSRTALVEHGDGSLQLLQHQGDQIRPFECEPDIQAVAS
jgi:UDP-2,3-diacylglucosamine pyrophosphatase LpxH